MSKKFLYQCFVVLVLALAYDWVAAIHIKKLIDNSFVWSVSTILAMHYLAFLGHVWFVEAQNNTQRFLITTAGAIGAAIGTILVISFF